MTTSKSATVASISDGRRFSLDHVETGSIASTDDLRVDVLCFEAGQTLADRRLDGGCIYRVVEGEAIVTTDAAEDGRIRLGKGKILAMPAGTGHTIENAGGGLLVLTAVLRTDGAA